jgi:hypothetical protein
MKAHPLEFRAEHQPRAKASIHDPSRIHGGSLCRLSQPALLMGAKYSFSMKRPLSPALSPSDAEGVRRTGEGNSAGFMVPAQAQNAKGHSP